MKERWEFKVEDNGTNWEYAFSFPNAWTVTAGIVILYLLGVYICRSFLRRFSVHYPARFHWAWPYVLYKFVRVYFFS